MSKPKRLGPNALWSRPGFPHRDWTWLTVRELADRDHTCDACDYQKVRFVHILSHADWPQYIEIGCVCAEYLTGQTGATRKAESRAKAAAKRRRDAHRERLERLQRVHYARIAIHKILKRVS